MSIRVEISVKTTDTGRYYSAEIALKQSPSGRALYFKSSWMPQVVLALDDLLRIIKNGDSRVCEDYRIQSVSDLSAIVSGVRSVDDSNPRQLQKGG